MGVKKKTEEETFHATKDESLEKIWRGYGMYPLEYGEIMEVGEMIAKKINQFKTDLLEKTDKLELRIRDLEEEIKKL